MNRLYWLVSALVALLFLAPLGWLVIATFRESSHVFRLDAADLLDPSGWTLDNYGAAWRRAHLARAFMVTILQVVSIAGIGLIVNSLAAFAFARLSFRGRDWLFGLVVGLIILPVEVLAVPLFFTARDLGLTGAFGPAFVGLTLPFAAKAFNVYLLRQHFLALPRELEEAGAIDGASVWQQFWFIALPSIRPALATVVLLDVITHWGDFLWPLLLATRGETYTLQIGLSYLFTQPPIDWGAILACAVLTTLPVVALFRLLQRYVVASDPMVGIK